MAFLRKVLSHLGFKKDEDDSRHHDKTKTAAGFRTKRAVPVPIDEGPVVSQCNYGNCGVQGLKWYSEMLRADEDGDVAQEFLRESAYLGRDKRQRYTLKAQLWTRPVKTKGPLCAVDGNVHQFVELGGELYWA